MSTTSGRSNRSLSQLLLQAGVAEQQRLDLEGFSIEEAALFELDDLVTLTGLTQARAIFFFRTLRKNLVLTNQSEQDRPSLLFSVHFCIHFSVL